MYTLGDALGHSEDQLFDFAKKVFWGQKWWKTCQLSDAIQGSIFALIFVTKMPLDGISLWPVRKPSNPREGFWPDFKQHHLGD
jgi:hypothetical protein